MKELKAFVCFLSFASAFLFVPCNLPAQDEVEDPCCYEDPFDPIIIVQPDGAPQDDGNEPCCYRVPVRGTNELRVQSGPPQDDGNEPCCYNAPTVPLTDTGDQKLALLPDRSLKPAGQVGLPAFPFSPQVSDVPMTAVLREQEFQKAQRDIRSFDIGRS